MFNQLFKKSSINVKNETKERELKSKNDESFNMSKYKEYLKNKKIGFEEFLNNNKEKGKEIINDYNINSEHENNLKLLEDNSLYNKKWKRKKKLNNFNEIYISFYINDN